MKRIKKYLRIVRFHFATIFLSSITVLAFIPFFTYLYFAQDLSSKEYIMNRTNTGLILYDKNDKPFFTFYDATYKKVIPLSKIPRHVQQAIIAAEDKEFYTHQGFSLRGILRSIYLNFQKRETTFGGSTITQQLVKNLLLSPKKNFLRKYQEVILAQEIERRYKKDEILEMYLNSVYFGEGAFGIEQAAQAFFGKETEKLTVGEASILAGILHSPSRYTPIHENRELVRKRQAYVLNAMESMKFVTTAKKKEIEKQPLTFTKKTEDINSVGIHFALMVKDILEKQYGEEQISRSGFKVRTSLDLTLQKYAEETVKKHVLDLAKNNVTNGAAVILDPKNGEIKALVGSMDWYNTSFGKVNMATTPRSPGSSFKPIIYAAAFEERLITPATALKDVPTVFQRTYRPQNYDRTFRGTVLVRRALANSLNVPAVEVMEKVGISSGLEMARRLGITSLKDPSNYGVSLILGTGEVSLLEMTHAYATFADAGTKHGLSPILSITDKHGKMIYTHKKSQEQVLEQEIAFLISSILSDRNARMEVFGNKLDTARPAAVKTGTAEDYKDALTIGYTPGIVVGVWVGNNNNASMDRVAGSLGAAPLWKSLLEHTLKDTAVETFEPPEGISQRSVCNYNGLLAGVGTGGKTEYFIAGTEPSRVCYIPKPTNQPVFPIDGKKDKEDKNQKKWQDIGGPQAGNLDQIQQQVKQEIEKEFKKQEEQIQVQIQQFQQLSPTQILR